MRGSDQYYFDGGEWVREDRLGIGVVVEIGIEVGVGVEVGIEVGVVVGVVVGVGVAMHLN